MVSYMDLVSCLREMVAQHCSTKSGYSAGFIGANEDAIGILLELGVMERLDQGTLVMGYELNKVREHIMVKEKE